MGAAHQQSKIMLGISIITFVMGLVVFINSLFQGSGFAAIFSLSLLAIFSFGLLFSQIKKFDPLIVILGLVVFIIFSSIFFFFTGFGFQTLWLAAPAGIAIAVLTLKEPKGMVKNSLQFLAYGWSFLLLIVLFVMHFTSALTELEPSMRYTLYAWVAFVSLMGGIFGLRTWFSIRVDRMQIRFMPSIFIAIILLSLLFHVIIQNQGIVGLNTFINFAQVLCFVGFVVILVMTTEELIDTDASFQSFLLDRRLRNEELLQDDGLALISDAPVLLPNYTELAASHPNINSLETAALLSPYGSSQTEDLSALETAALPSPFQSPNLPYPPPSLTEDLDSIDTVAHTSPFAASQIAAERASSRELTPPKRPSLNAVKTIPPQAPLPPPKPRSSLEEEQTFLLEAPSQSDFEEWKKRQG